MHTKKLPGQLWGIDTSNDDEKSNNWAALVQCLEKQSIMMFNSLCKRNGPEAWKRLTAHYSSSEKLRVMNSLEQLIPLSLKPSEEMSAYLIRAETLSRSIEVAGKKFSGESVSVFLKGLPDNYEYFKMVHDFSKNFIPFSD